MNLLRGLGVVPLLWRLLKAIVGIQLELAKIREALDLQLKLQCLQSDIKVSELKEAEEILSANDSPMELLDQTDEDFAELERIEREKAKLGGRVSLEEDLLELKRQEEDDGR